MDRWQCVKPEECVKGVWYSFSYNPQAQPMLEAINKVDPFGCNLQDWYKEEISSFCRLKYCDIECRLEISSRGRFHVHGRIRVKDVIRFFSVDLRRMQARGSYEIDRINDPIKWDLYCRKQSEVMSDFCESEGICYLYRNFLDIVI